MHYKAADASHKATCGASSGIISGRAAARARAGQPMPADATYRFPASLQSAAERCWKKAAAPSEWGLAREQFQSALERSVAKRFAGQAADSKNVEAYLETLHLEELALACACSAGNAAAWDHFMAQYRPELYRAARAIAGRSDGGKGNARELADSIYAELYGLRESGGKRKSLFDYYHGRSKLGTWLHAILAQRHVDEIRRVRRMESLDEPAEDGGERREPAAANPAPDAERERYLVMLQAAVTGALAALETRDRLRLAYYYAEELTLAEIGRLMREHESTVSRQLERTRKQVRRRVEAALREEKKLSEAQLRLCYEYAREEWPFDLTLRLRAGQAGAATARD
jgi:RNA polymerase sigma-70 factor, ECF subfamily